MNLSLSFMVATLVASLALCFSAAPYTPPSGGVWLFGVSESTLSAYSVELSYPAGSNVTSRWSLPLARKQSSGPPSKSWAQDSVSGRLVMWHTTLGEPTCALETVHVQAAPASPKLASTWIVPAQFCVPSVKVLLDSHMSSTVFVLVGLPSPRGLNTTLLQLSGPRSGVGPASVSVVSSKIPVGVQWSGGAAIDSHFHNLHIVNTTLLCKDQNVVSVSLISGEVTIENDPIKSGGFNRLSALQFNPHKIDQAWATADYNTGPSGGTIVELDVSSSPWAVSRLTSTNLAYNDYHFDFAHETAYAGSPSWTDAFDVHHGNPQVGVIALTGNWYSGTVFPFVA